MTSTITINITFPRIPFRTKKVRETDSEKEVAFFKLGTYFLKGTLRFYLQLLLIPVVGLLMTSAGLNLINLNCPNGTCMHTQTELPNQKFFLHVLFTV